MTAVKEKYTTTEIKKALYKEKPKAYLVATDGFEAHYSAEISLGHIAFHIPFDEMGGKPFEDGIPAQLLIRWL